MTARLLDPAGATVGLEFDTGLRTEGVRGLLVNGLDTALSVFTVRAVRRPPPRRLAPAKGEVVAEDTSNTILESPELVEAYLG